MGWADHLHAVTRGRIRQGPSDPEPQLRVQRQDPVRLAGQGACPPQDGGGPWGYIHLRGILADPPATSTRTCWPGWDSTREPTSTPTGST